MLETKLGFFNFSGLNRNCNFVRRLIICKVVNNRMIPAVNGNTGGRRIDR
jgi:hypothetical protein